MTTRPAHAGPHRRDGRSAMLATRAEPIPWWAWVWPLLAGAALAAKASFGVGVILAPVSAAVLVATVFAAVYHAEVVAHRVGEPFGTLVLALAVTVIEGALIVSVMLGGGPESETLARDTVFATVMLICNGLAGLCVLVGGIRHREQGFQVHGAAAGMAVLAALVVLSLVLPNYTTSAAGPRFSTSQLLFAGTASLVLYGTFVFVQTVRHREYFLYDADAHPHGTPPSQRAALISLGLLLVCLAGVVLLAKALTPYVRAGVAWAGAPEAVVGIVIAAVVLLPESTAALRAARRNRLQTTLNLGLGSALSSMGLTIPAVALASILLHRPLILGLGPKEQVLLALTLLIGVMTMGTGRTTVLQGMVHLVILAAFLFLAIVP